MTVALFCEKIYIIRCSCFGNRVFKTSEKGIRIKKSTEYSVLYLSLKRDNFDEVLMFVARF